MKNKTIKIISIITTFILISSIFIVPAVAISTSCLENHFSELHTTEDEEGTEIIHTPPSENTCPYVAMSLLLTYYDTYWNDSFVEEKYDWQPGDYNPSSDTLTETFAATVEAQDWKEYINSLSLPDNTETYPYYPLYAMTKVDDFLEPYLILFGRHLGYHSLTDTKLGLSDSETVDVLEYYLYNVRGFTSAQVTVEYLHEDDGDIESQIRELIDEGYPVIYIGKNGESTTNNSDQIDNVGSDEKDKKDENDIVGHELIAFGYDDSGDIYLHTGWKRNNPVTTISSTDYKYNRAIIWLEINEAALPHSHTNNYTLSGTDDTVCACQIYESHPNHPQNHYYVQKNNYSKHWQECCCGDSIIEEESHNYSYTYQNYIQHKAVCDDCEYETITPHSYVEKNSKTNRWKECACGDIKVLHYHEYEYLNLNGNQHIATCAICDYSISENHMYGNHEKISSTQHESSCVCGDTRTESHAGFEYDSISNFKHEVYCKCGYLIGASNHVMTKVGTRNVCTICGASFSSFSDITIKGTEDEHETHIE